MGNTSYNWRKGEHKRYDPKTRKWTVSPIKYQDFGVPTSHVPKQPDDEYFEKFEKFAFEILEAVNKKTKHEFILDYARLDGHAGNGYVDGVGSTPGTVISDFAVFAVRKDHIGELSSAANGLRTPSHADYQLTLRAIDSIQYFENDTTKELVAMTIREALAIDAKP
jgi:hypothetical protein